MKIIYTLILLLVSICTSAQTIEGDVNEDGEVTIEDITELIGIYLNYDAVPDEDGNDKNEMTVTGTATNITSYTADITAWANNIMNSQATDLQVGIIYCTDGTPNKSNGTKKIVNRSIIGNDSKYTVTLSGLAPATTYYYRSFVYQSGLYFYGKVMEFKTLNESEKGAHFYPGEITNLTCFSAKVSARVTVDGGYILSDYGICLSDDADLPENKWKSVSANSRYAGGSYFVQLTALAGSTKYYYRPYAVVNGYKKYGDVSSFTTKTDNVVVTGDFDEETKSIVGNRLTLTGGAFSTLEVGLCWSRINSNPTIGDFSESTSELDDENEFYTGIMLGVGITYYRAYVKIDGVAHYGSVKKSVEKQQVCEYVDLGLPSGIKWATCNVGASSPEEYGDYFAWGETTPKSEYDWDTYKWCNGSNDTMTKYCTISSDGIVDNKTFLDPEDDAAHVNWGGDWRMPTKEEQDELCKKCTWSLTTVNGVYGRKVVGPNGNSIFLPAAGCRNGSSFSFAGSYGYYWSSSLSSFSSDAYYLNFFPSDVHWYSNFRLFGFSIRPVCK